MAVWSEVSTKDIFGAIRLDAQFYQPQYRDNENLLRNFRHLVTLGEVSPKFVKGIFDINADEYTEIGIPFVRISNLKNGFISENNLAYISPERHLIEHKTSLKKYDIVLSKTAYPAAALVQLDECNTSQDIIAVRTNQTPQFNCFLVTFLNTRFGMLQMERLFQGNIQSHLSLDEARTILVPLPDDAFIATVADMFHQSQHQRTRSLELYAEAETLLLDALGLNDLDTTNTLAYEANFREAAAAGRFDTNYFQPKYTRVRQALSRLPNCQIVPLEAVLSELTNGQTPLRHDLSVGEVSFLTAEHVDDFRLDLASKKRVMLEHHNKLLQRTQLRLNDVLITIKGRVGNAAVVENLPGPVNINQDVAVIRAQEHIPPYYLAGYLNSLAGKLLTEQVCTGQINPFLGLGNLKTIPIPIFSETEMKRLARLTEDKVSEAHQAAHDAQSLLENAKRRVEELIEGADS